jgi:hypothetical protein
MTNNGLNIREKILKGLEISYQKLVKSKIDRNLDLVVSDNGKVIYVDPRKYLK